MTHAVEVSEFEAAFASRAVPAWPQLGPVFESDVSTEQMLNLAHLKGWDVHQRPVTVEGVDPERFAKPAFAVVRTNPFDNEPDVLATVGQRYRVFQNEELLDFGQAIVHDGGRWETAGSIHDGRQVFASLSMPNDVVIDPEGAADKINSYLILMTSHDGTCSIFAGNTPVRVVCSNTLNFAMSGIKQSFKIRHTQNAEGKIQAAREALGFNIAYMDQFSKDAEALYQTEMTNAQFEGIFKELYPLADDAKKAATTRWDKKFDLASDLFVAHDENASNANILGTAWAGLNALTEMGQWYRKPRSGDAESTLAAGSGFDAIANAERNRQRKAVNAFAGV